MHSTRPRHLLRLVAPLVAIVLLAAACGDDGGDFQDLLQSANQSSSADDDLEEFGEIVNEVLGAGGGGTLFFDGVEYPIDSVVCANSPDRFDAGTTGASGHRVFVSGDVERPNSQILDPDFVQWFEGDRVDPATRNLATFDGSTFTGPLNTWWNNQDDRTVQASFSFTCP